MQSTMTPPHSRLQELDTEINRLHTLLELLATERDDLLEENAARQALTTAFHRIPPEIFQEIFRFCLPSTRPPVMHNSEGPLLLGQVCSLWRHIAFNTPRLWTSVHVVVPKHSLANAKLSEDRHRAMEEWLCRSRRLPLSVSLHTTSALPVGDITPFISTLVAHSQRWKAIDLRVPSAYLPSFSPLDASSVPLLESFKLTDNFSNAEGVGSGGVGEGAFDNSLWANNLGFLEHCPNVSELSLTRERGCVYIPALPFSTLTSLTLSANDHLFLYIDGYIQLLLRCINLESFSLTIADWEYNPLLITPDAICLSKLKRISLSVAAYPSATLSLAMFLDSLTLPAVEEMELGGISHPESDTNTISSLTSLLTRSSPPLTKLSLRKLAFNKDAFAELAPVLGSVQELVLNGVPDIGDNLLDVMARPCEAGSELPLPKLEHIILSDCLHSVNPTLMHFLHSRSSDPKLKSADLDFIAPIKSEFYAEFERFRMEGMELVVNNHHGHGAKRHGRPTGTSPFEGL